MTVSEKIAQLRAYALTAKTAIYNEDAMTAIELAGQTACKVNECVVAINGILDILDKIETNGSSVDLSYNAESEGIII